MKTQRWLLLLFLVLVPALARAESFQFTGGLISDSGIGCLPLAIVGFPSVNCGDPVSGSFSYVPGVGPATLSVNVGNQTFSSSAIGQDFVDGTVDVWTLTGSIPSLNAIMGIVVYGDQGNPPCPFPGVCTGPDYPSQLSSVATFQIRDASSVLDVDLLRLPFFDQHFINANISITPAAAVPEPSTFALMAIGLAALVGVKRLH